MKLDEVLLDEALAQPETSPTLRVYGFRRPAVTYGYFQKLPAHWLEDPFYESARRVTGGGLVFHGKDFTYSFVAPSSARPSFRTPQSSYRAFHEVIQNSFRKFGISVDFALPDPRPRSARRFCFLSPVKNDLLFGRYKVAGAAQKRSGGFFLHQGSVNLRAFLDSDSRLGPSARALGLQGGSETGGFGASCPSAHVLGPQDGRLFTASSPGLARGLQPQQASGFLPQAFRSPRRGYSPAPWVPDDTHGVGECPSDTDRCDREHRARSLDSGYFPFFEAFKKAFLASFREYFQVDFVIQFTTGYERNRPLDFQTAGDRRGEPHLQAGSL